MSTKDMMKKNPKKSKGPLGQRSPQDNPQEPYRATISSKETQRDFKRLILYKKLARQHKLKTRNKRLFSYKLAIELNSNTGSVIWCKVHTKYLISFKKFKICLKKLVYVFNKYYHIKSHKEFFQLQFCLCKVHFWYHVRNILSPS